MRAREALGIARTVLFSPEDLQLVRGEPAARRRLFKSNLHITLSGTYQQMKSADSDHFFIGYCSPKGGVFDKYSDANASLTLTYTPTGTSGTTGEAGAG